MRRVAEGELPAGAAAAASNRCQVASCVWDAIEHSTTVHDSVRASLLAGSTKQYRADLEQAVSHWQVVGCQIMSRVQVLALQLQRCNTAAGAPACALVGVTFGVGWGSCCPCS